LPEGIRGYGHIKEENLARVRQKWEAGLHSLEQITTGEIAA